MSAEPKPIMACRKIKFTNRGDAVAYGMRGNPQYKWKSYFCHVCLAYHMARKKNHHSKGKGKIQILTVAPHIQEEAP
jgi:hypothetical protein